MMGIAAGYRDGEAKVSSEGEKFCVVVIVRVRR
jgi:hypothetical protein